MRTADLLILPLKAEAPAPAAASFFVPNGRGIVRQLIHGDGFNTLYLRLEFPSGSLASVNGEPVAATDSVRVTLDPRAGAYGMTLSPAGLAFRSGAFPSATFSFARYGDASAAQGSTRYASAVEYAAALELWEEISPGRWRRVRPSGTTGADAVRGSLAAGGSFVVAAPR